MSEENEENAETTESQEGESTTTPAATGLENPLSKATDRAVRPGFRSPANKGSKADKKKKRKKR